MSHRKRAPRKKNYRKMILIQSHKHLKVYLILHQVSILMLNQVSISVMSIHHYLFHIHQCVITPCHQDTFIHPAMVLLLTDTLTNQILDILEQAAFHILEQAVMSFHLSHSLTHIAIHTHHHALSQYSNVSQLSSQSNSVWNKLCRKQYMQYTYDAVLGFKVRRPTSV